MFKKKSVLPKPPEGYDDKEDLIKLTDLLETEINNYKTSYVKAGYKEDANPLQSEIKHLNDLLNEVKKIQTTGTIDSKKLFLKKIKETEAKLTQRESSLGVASAYGIGDGSRGVLDKIKERFEKMKKLPVSEEYVSIDDNPENWANRFLNAIRSIKEDNKNSIDAAVMALKNLHDLGNMNMAAADKIKENLSSDGIDIKRINFLFEKRGKELSKAGIKKESFFDDIGPQKRRTKLPS